MASYVLDKKKWYRIRYKALVRDNYTCRFCSANVRGKGNAHVDHIEMVVKRPDLAYELSNLQTLCAHCHNSIKQRDEKNPDRGCNENGYTDGWE